MCLITALLSTSFFHDQGEVWLKSVGRDRAVSVRWSKGTTAAVRITSDWR